MKNFLPDIKDYIDNLSDQGSITVNNLDELIYIIRSKTGLEYNQCKIILEEIFKNIRQEILKNNKIIIKEIGSFYITNKTKQIGFRSSNKIRKKLNGK